MGIVNSIFVLERADYEIGRPSWKQVSRPAQHLSQSLNVARISDEDQ
jgi:hypothetical protein